MAGIAHSHNTFSLVINYTLGGILLSFSFQMVHLVLHAHHAADILTFSTSSVSMSTITSSLDSANEGTVMSLTSWPSRPWITLVEKCGWQPTK